MLSARSIALSLGAFVAASLAPLSSAAKGQCESTESAQIVSADADTSDGYGAAAAVSGSIVLGGAPAESEGGANAGALYVHDSSLGLEQKFVGLPGDELGTSVDLSPPYAAFGMPSPALPGFVGVLEQQSDGSWIRLTSWGADIGGVGPGDRYGWDVAIEGTMVAGGAPMYDGVMLDGGLVEVRAEDKTGLWASLQILLPPGGGAGDQFGWSVAMRGGVLVVGAPFHDSPLDNTGIVHVYRWNGVEFRWEQALSPTHSFVDAWFGYSVDTDGERILVGAPGNGFAGAGSGIAYVFEEVGGGWVLDEDIAPLDLAAGDGFGASCQLIDDIAVISSPHADPNGLADAGAGYQFRNVGTSWILQQKLVASDPDPAAWLGTATATDGETMLLGAPQAFTSLPATGAVYQYELDDLTLDIDPESAKFGDPVTFTVCGGPKGHKLFLYVLALNGKPFVQRIATGTFDGEGTWSLSDKYSDPALAGIEIDCASFGFNALGKVVMSNVVSLEFE